MGLSYNGGTALADGGVGSIVWVRRRNGSWWPGKILGAAELSTSHLTSPRSGTPVKLLGREDATVDWYNLEKSKRVKAFRCGEFDDCIERAEASLGVPTKKREKYARREDAILHALELEKQLLEKKNVKLGTNFSYMRNNASGSAVEDIGTSSGALQNGNDRNESFELQQLAKKCASPTEDERNTDSSLIHKGKSVTWQSLGNPETKIQTRGLQDFGIKSDLLKKMVSSSSVALNGLHKGMSDGQSQALSAGVVYLGGSSDVDSGNSSDTGKGLADEYAEESIMKRHDRRRPLVQVMQTSAKQPDCSLQPDGDIFSALRGNYTGGDAQVKRHRSLYLPPESTHLVDIDGDPYGQKKIVASQLGIGNYSSRPEAFMEDAIAGSLEDTESDASETDSKKHNMVVEMPKISAVNKPMKVQSRAVDGLELQVYHERTSSEESCESLPKDTSQSHSHNPMSLDMEVSRWKLKGKRNVRNLTRRPMDKFSHGMYLEPSSIIQRPNHNLRFYHDHYYINDIDSVGDDLDSHTEGYGNREYMSKAASRRQNFAGSIKVDFEELTWGDRFEGHWGGRSGVPSLIYGGRHGREMLFDVDLKVQADHQREHVPWVSLMSRLNGKPVLGHPIQIETVGDGSTDALLSTDPFGNCEYEEDRNSASPVWTTARRTANFRVPRTHLSLQLDEADNQHFDQDKRLRSQKSVSGSSAAKKKYLARRKPPYVPKPLSQRKKPPTKLISSSIKIRHLSSIGTNQMLVSEPRDGSFNDSMDGVIKPLGSGPPKVACIPVKLVFSRLLEGVGRLPSGLAGQRGFDEQQ